MPQVKANENKVFTAVFKRRVNFTPLQGQGPLQSKMQRPLPEPDPLQGGDRGPC